MRIGDCAGPISYSFGGAILFIRQRALGASEASDAERVCARTDAGRLLVSHKQRVRRGEVLAIAIEIRAKLRRALRSSGPVNNDNNKQARRAEQIRIPVRFGSIRFDSNSEQLNLGRIHRNNNRHDVLNKKRRRHSRHTQVLCPRGQGSNREKHRSSSGEAFNFNGKSLGSGSGRGNNNIIILSSLLCEIKIYMPRPITAGAESGTDRETDTDTDEQIYCEPRHLHGAAAAANPSTWPQQRQHCARTTL